MSIEQNKEIGIRLVSDGWGTNPGWEKVFDELFANNIIWYFGGWTEPIRGIEATKAVYQGLFQSFPDIYITEKDVLADVEGVMIRTTLKGTHKGEFLGIAPTGCLVNITDMSFFRLYNGKAIEWWYEINLLGVIKQLGVDLVG